MCSTWPRAVGSHQSAATAVVYGHLCESRSTRPVTARPDRLLDSGASVPALARSWVPGTLSGYTGDKLWPRRHLCTVSHNHVEDVCTFAKI